MPSTTSTASVTNVMTLSHGPNIAPKSKLNIQQNRSQRKYSNRELLLRMIWGLGKIPFRCSPRPLYGWRRMLLRVFGAQVSDQVNISNTADIFAPWNLKIGSYSSIGNNTRIYNLGKLTIGQNVTISQGVHLCGGTHDFRKDDFPLIKSKITLGDDAWICADAFIGPDVEIGAATIVAARSVVIKSAKPNSIIGGNPAKFIKNRV